MSTCVFLDNGLVYGVPSEQGMLSRVLVSDKLKLIRKSVSQQLGSVMSSQKVL